jgi:hypothetical protein
MHDFRAYSCPLCTLKKMSRCDGIDTVMPVIADRHGKAEAVLPDLTCVNAGLGRDDVVEWCHPIAPPRIQEDTEVLRVSVGCPHQPENHDGLEKGTLIFSRRIAVAQQAENGCDTWPAFALIFERGRYGQSLARVFLGQAEQTSVLTPMAIEAFDNQNRAVPKAC